MYGIIGKGVVGKAIGNTLNDNVLYWDLENDYTFEEFVSKCHTIIICVPSLQIGAGETIEKNLTMKYALRISKISERVAIVQKSTCLPGTADYIVSKIKNPYYVAPEFLSQKTAYEDALNPERIVVGSHKYVPIVSSVFDLVTIGARPDTTDTMIYRVTCYEAECIKLVANSLMATLISFWNDMYMTLGIDQCVAEAVCNCKDLRSCYRVFGKAFGGACLPKDTMALFGATKSKMLEAVINVNLGMKDKYGEQTLSMKELWAEESAWNE
jgi:UDP-glucose 6-dehydrogenase